MKDSVSHSLLEMSYIGHHGAQVLNRLKCEDAWPSGHSKQQIHLGVWNAGWTFFFFLLNCDSSFKFSETRSMRD